MTDRSLKRTMCVIQIKDSKRAGDIMLILCLNETIDQLAMANCA